LQLDKPISVPVSAPPFPAERLTEGAMPDEQKRRAQASRKKRIRRGKLPPTPDPYQPLPIDRLDVEQTRDEFAERWQRQQEIIRARGVLPPEHWPDIKRNSGSAAASASLRTRERVVLERLQAGHLPGKREAWKAFQLAIEKKLGKPTSIRQLARLVRRLMPG
jgi:hypothetical protein